MTVDGGEADSVILGVHNFGKPIAADILPNLFAPLVRGSLEDMASTTSAGANLGLGLYIVNTIVIAHAGTIEVTSSADKGTQFVVRLPRHSGQSVTPSMPAIASK